MENEIKTHNKISVVVKEKVSVEMNTLDDLMWFQLCDQVDVEILNQVIGKLRNGVNRQVNKNIVGFVGEDKSDLQFRTYHALEYNEIVNSLM